MSAYHRTREWGKVARQAKTRDGWRCVRCSRAGRLEADHIVPVVDGGAVFDLANVQTLCRGCHRDKTRAEAAARRRTSPAVERWRAYVDELL